jgi:hypothetical protein
VVLPFLRRFCDLPTLCGRYRFRPQDDNLWLHARGRQPSDRLGAYFQKINCFCFTEQTMAAGEKREMPVVAAAAARDRPRLALWV